MENNKEKIKEYYQKNKERILKKSKEWKTKNKEKLNENFKKDCLKYPLHHKARSLAQKIKIPKGKLCEVCNKELAKERHHKDYEKPLEVILVCVSCHKVLDKLKMEKENVA